LLYDIAALIAESLDATRASDPIKDRLIGDVFDYIDSPSTEYSGEYYGTEQGDEGSNRRSPDA
jgi:hypothetical protein